MDRKEFEFLVRERDALPFPIRSSAPSGRNSSPWRLDVVATTECRRQSSAQRGAAEF